MGGGSGTSLPSGEVCFLFTDVESSTALLRELGSARWGAVQETMHRVIRAAVESAGGSVVNTEGDGCFAAFPSAEQAARACDGAQHELRATQWPAGAEPRVRMGLHLAHDAQPRDGDYVALAVHQAARVMSAASGGQVLATQDVAERCSPGRFADLGLFSVRDFDGPVRLFALTREDERATLPRVPPAFDTQVPRYLSGLVGREREIEAVLAEVRTARLLTLVGPPGVGKTRVSVAVLSQLSAEVAGPWFVDLTEARKPVEVGEVIASAVGCPPETDLGVHLDTVLADRRGVLVLDHCDHLEDAARATAELLLDWCPTLHIVATAVAPLGVRSERTFEVPPLDLPNAPDAAEVMDSGSGRLLVERATAARPGLSLTETSASAVYELCHLVGGVPLSLELLAGMCGAATPESVRAQVMRGDIDEVIDVALHALPRLHLRALTALTVPESPVAPVLATAAVAAIGVGQERADAVLAELVRSGLIRLDPDGRFMVLMTLRSRIEMHVNEADRATVAMALLDACLEATSGEAAPLARYAPVAATASALLDEEALPVAERQRLAVQLAPWWRGRLGAPRAREQLLAALRLSDSGMAAAALHLAIADTYAPGQETVDTERHVQRAAVLLGEHDAIDAALVERLKQATSRAARERRPDGSH